MLYELRIYHVVPGRLQELLNRFRVHNLRLFPKYDLNITNFWVNADEAVNQFYYVIEHKDLEAREKNFQAFMEDPEWAQIRKQTESNGPLYEKIDEIFMNNAPFFPAPAK
ncbi:NIPSNAP protein [Paenibacillus taihuensis]|uniref:NIPSNAP protein n=1 Tax=Paenibacillus taihuensis TaxID=1156355 RepID=A0A3D9QUN9_9BACL|nr:NIPSNAP family protein [Paenibacillus taihuensis]REE67615.1 NIPSNAP protein [Paenibacillus taihuensis]